MLKLFHFSILALGILISGCICDGPVSTQFVSGINQVYFADSVANVVEPIIQFTYEVETGNESNSGKKTGCMGYRKELGISIRSFVLADSVKVTCNRDLPGTPAGHGLEGNPHVLVVKTTNPAYVNHLRGLSFQSNWTVSSWQSMPDTAVITFHFKLNTGEVITKQNSILFAK